MSIYKEIILEHYNHPHNVGEVNDYTAIARVSNPLCGDRITMTAKIQDKKIIDIRFHGHGCAISTASASLLTDFLKNKEVDVLIKLNQSDILSMLGVELSPNRLKCALISLEAAHKLIKSR